MGMKTQKGDPKETQNPLFGTLAATSIHLLVTRIKFQEVNIQYIHLKHFLKIFKKRLASSKFSEKCYTIYKRNSQQTRKHPDTVALRIKQGFPDLYHS